MEKKKKFYIHIGDMREGGPTIYCQFVWLSPRFVLSFERSWLMVINHQTIAITPANFLTLIPFEHSMIFLIAMI